MFGGGDTGGVDQEKVAAGDALLDLVKLVRGRDGNVVGVDVGGIAFDHALPPSMSVPPNAPPCCSPRTSASKSVSPLPLLASNPLVIEGPLKLINSLREVDVALLAPNSWSLRVCSFSTRADMDLMRAM